MLATNTTYVGWNRLIFGSAKSLTFMKKRKQTAVKLLFFWLLSTQPSLLSARKDSALKKWPGYFSPLCSIGTTSVTAFYLWCSVLCSEILLTGIGDVTSDVNFVTEGGFTRILQCRCGKTLRSEFQLNMKAASFLDASATIYHTTRCNIPGENDLYFFLVFLHLIILIFTTVPVPVAARSKA